MKTTILCGKLITGVPDAETGPATIMVQDGVVQSVEAGHKTSGTDTCVYDFSQHTVLPGLIDLHEHLNGNDKYSFSDGSVDPSDAT